MQFSPFMSSHGKILGTLLSLSILMDCSPWVGAAERPTAPPAPELDSQKLLQAAQAAFKQGQRAEAVLLADKAIAVDPSDPKCYALRGQFFESMGDHVRAIADYDQVIKRDPKAALVYQRRGVEHFRAGNFKQSVADFDKFLDFVPAQAPQHWQRGISCYYAGMFEEGRKQFELHQTVNPQDVENAVWHFLCVARATSVERARASLIPVTGDSRVPMAEVQLLFAGKLKPEDVLKAAQAGEGSRERRNEQLFYAHLYLGLYFEAVGDSAKAREHILRAATEFKSDHYMGDVARVHAAVLKAKGKGKAP
jgi:lipoprotein NlpI